MHLAANTHDLTDPALAARYDRFLMEVPDSLFQHTSLWANIVSPLSADRPILITAEGPSGIAGTLLVYLYENDLGNVLFSNPHAGSAGCLCLHPTCDLAATARLLVEAAEETARLHDCVTITLTSNPFAAVEPVGKYFEYDYRLENTIHYVDVPGLFDEAGNIVLRDYNRRSNLSRNLRKARESGWCITHCRSLEQLRAWYEIHVSRVHKLGGTPIPRELFENAYLSDARPDHVELLLASDERGTVHGGGFHVFNHYVVDIFMLSSTDEAIRAGSNYLLADYALKWAHQKGIKIYNWQASNPPQGGIVRFKQQWGSASKRYHYFTKITGNIKPIMDAGLEAVREAYRWHYVVPFAVFDQPTKRCFAKGDSPRFLAR